jgi:integrase
VAEGRGRGQDRAARRPDLGELKDEYLRYKADRGKRTVQDDKRILEGRLVPAFGPTLQIRKLTGPVIAQYEKKRAGEVSAYTVSKELSVLRHMLRLAKRWGYVNAVPEIEMPKKPEGRLRYLETDEIGKLLDACRESRNPYLACIVPVSRPPPHGGESSDHAGGVAEGRPGDPGPQ